MGTQSLAIAVAEPSRGVSQAFSSTTATRASVVTPFLPSIAMSVAGCRRLT